MKGYKKDKAQALMELSILGGIFIVFLAALIGYGLKYHYQQQVMQRAFRKALPIAYHRGQIDYLFVSDREFSDPADTFGLGQNMPTMSTASLVRDNRLNENADYPFELPALAIDIKGLKGGCPGSGGPVGGQWCKNCANDDSNCKNTCQMSPPGSPRPCYYLTAGFLTGPNGSIHIRVYDTSTAGNLAIAKAILKKYYLIFGEGSVDRYKAGWQWLKYDDEEDEWNGYIRVIDRCNGEILSYDYCERQCRMITEADFCRKICVRSDETNCANICQESIVVPWYCKQIAGFGDKLDRLFSFAASEIFQSMGIQQDVSAGLNTKDNTLRKRETPAAIRTRDTFNWSKSNFRIIIFRKYGDETGESSWQPIESVVGQNRVRVWETPW
jgi:hypothetical protein